MIIIRAHHLWNKTVLISTYNVWHLQNWMIMIQQVSRNANTVIPQRIIWLRALESHV